MSKILQLKEHDLYLTFSWSNVNHGISGHYFEVLDYYLLLKSHFNTGILLCEDITWDTFEIAIRDKYNLSEDEIRDIKNNTVFQNRPSLVKGKNILFTDGSVNSMNNITLLFDNIFLFACGYKTPKDYKKGIVLQDYRVYPKGENTIDYRKKINFNKYKHLQKVEPEFETLIYGSKNCREIDDKTYRKLNNKYKNILCLVNEIPDSKYSEITFKEIPYKNLFENFNKYIYTPVSRHWDCSPRFLAECKFYNRAIDFFEINYIYEDLGLKYRWEDIIKRFKSLYLNDNDPIIKILKDYIE